MEESFLCKYSDWLGKPGEGFHELRLGGLALMDLMGTVGLAWFLSRTWKWALLNMYEWFIVLIVLSVVLHKLFCVKTALLEKLNLG